LCIIGNKNVCRCAYWTRVYVYLVIAQWDTIDKGMIYLRTVHTSHTSVTVCLYEFCMIFGSSPNMVVEWLALLLLNAVLCGLEIFHDYVHILPFQHSHWSVILMIISIGDRVSHVILAMPWLRQLVVSLSLWRPRFDPRLRYERFVVDGVALGRIFIKLLLFFLVSFDLPMLCSHPSCCWYCIVLVIGSIIK
jgi:hypothetical protein